MNNIQKSPSRFMCRRWKYIILSVLIPLLIIAALVFIWFTQDETKPDLASEKLIREAAAVYFYGQTNFKKEPNDITDEDFAKITEFQLANKEFSDIKLLEKFTNLQKLDLSNIKYPNKNLPKWMKILAKFGIYDIDERFALDVGPLRNLSSLKLLRLSGTQISDIKSLKGLINLEMLFIDGTRVNNLEPLKGLTNLRYLSIVETTVSSLEPIKQLRKLEALIMFYCRKITDEQVKALRTACPGLAVKSERD